MNKSQEATEEQPRKPRRKHAADRRAEFIDVAVRLFAGRRYSDVSIDEIASEAGVAKSLLYYYFGDKRGLYVAGLQRLASEMFEQLAGAATDTSAEPLERLMLGLDAHLAFIERYPDGYRELLASASTHPEIQEIVDSGQAIILELLLSNLPPEVPRGPAVELALKGWGGFVDRAELAWLADRRADREQVRELCGRMLVSAIFVAVEVDKKGQRAEQNAA